MRGDGFLADRIEAGAGHAREDRRLLVEVMLVEDAVPSPVVPPGASGGHRPARVRLRQIEWVPPVVPHFAREPVPIEPGAGAVVVVTRDGTGVAVAVKTPVRVEEPGPDVVDLLLVIDAVAVRPVHRR